MNDIPDWAQDIAKGILQTVKLKDPHTFYHCCRVGRGARRLGQAMGLNDFEQAILEYSGLFHDVGNVAVPDNILLKPAKLDPEEVEIMKTHPLKSAEVVEPFSHHAFFRFLMPGIKFHHEKIDGSGYPYGLEGDNIPLLARVIAIVDTVDAMTNKRPYRKALTMDVVLQELRDFSGVQFDTQLVNIYLDAHKFWKPSETAEKDEVVVQQVIAA